MTDQLPILAPSILAADYSQLGAQIEECNKADTQWIHCDIMDGHFVPNISYGPDIVKAAAQSTDAFIDVHLMIEHPDNFIQAFAEAGADQITVHQEACTHLHRTIQNIHSYDIAAGVALNPATPLQMLKPVLNEIDLALVMSVNPGFGGQTFIPKTYDRLQEMRVMRQSADARFLIEVDGGVNLENIQKVTQAGADILVAGSAVFKSKNIPQQIKELNKRARAGRGTIA